MRYTIANLLATTTPMLRY